MTYKYKVLISLHNLRLKSIGDYEEWRRLGEIENRVKSLSPSHFIPKRFPSSSFIAIKYSIPNVINQIYYNE